jgi:hypothetical protein
MTEKRIALSPDFLQKGYGNLAEHYLEIFPLKLPPVEGLRDTKKHIQQTIQEYVGAMREVLENDRKEIPARLHIPLILTSLVANYHSYPNNVKSENKENGSDIIEDFFIHKRSAHCGERSYVLKKLCSIFNLKARLVSTVDIIGGGHGFIEVDTGEGFEIFDPTFAIWIEKNILETSIKNGIEKKFLFFNSHDYYVFFEKEKEFISRRKEILAIFGQGLFTGRETMLKMGFLDYALPFHSISIDEQHVYSFEMDSSSMLKKIPHLIRTVAIFGKGRASKEVQIFCAHHGLKVKVYIDDFLSGENIVSPKEFIEYDMKNVDCVLSGFWQKGELGAMDDICIPYYRLFPPQSPYFLTHLAYLTYSDK